MGKSNGKSAAAPLLELLARRAALAGESRAPLKVAGLFAGIGGLEKGLHRAHHQTILLNEIDTAAREVLKHHFPDVRQHGDVQTLRWLPRDTDIVVGGFPCQDLSQAGQTRGIAGSRSGLVGEVFRLVEHRRVPWLLLENVPFMLRLARGRALEVIVAELERLGYRWAYRVVDSRAFGLPQRRERVYMLASLDEDPRDVLFVDDVGEPDITGEWKRVACGFYWTEGVRGLGWAVDAVPTLKGGSTVGIPSPPAIITPSGELIRPDIRDAERLQGFQSDWTKPAENVGRRGARWKLVGNAVTVDAAQWIGERLRTPGAYDGSYDEPLNDGTPWPRAAWNMGYGRHTAVVSRWPMRLERPSLLEFLHYSSEPLSLRATRGFLARARSSSLRFPEGFLKAVEAHADRMSAAQA